MSIELSNSFRPLEKPMATQSQVRYRSDEICTRAGRYRFGGFVDGTPDPQLSDRDKFTDIAIGDRFPRLRQISRPCWWLSVDDATEPLELSVARM